MATPSAWTAYDSATTDADPLATPSTWTAYDSTSTDADPSSPVAPSTWTAYDSTSTDAATTEWFVLDGSSWVFASMTVL